MNEKEHIRQLAARYLIGQATEAEKIELHQWYDQHIGGDEDEIVHDDPGSASDIRERIYQRIHTHIHPTKKRRSTWYYAAAAILIVALAAGLFISRHSGDATDVAPGYNQATLTLADGTKINLDSAKAGIQINDEDMNYNDGTKISASIHHSSSITYNSLATPRGGQYQIILSDGTKVWLNAASTLKYPSRFSGDKREVFLEGEGYFEIKEDKTKPFKVLSKGQEVLVLGTSFNVAAYDDGGAIKTTLVTGAVEVSSNKRNEHINHSTNQQLKPSQQAINNNGEIQVKTADINSAVAWKNHEFNFSNTPLKDIMHQLERWYDIEVVHIDQLPDKNFYGQMSRDVKLSQVLDMIQETSHLTFKIEGRRIIYQTEEK